MKSFKLIPIIIFTLMLSGCMGTEPNDIAYAIAIGIDTGENSNYKITIQFAKPTQISGGGSEEGGSGGGDIVENVVVEAPNIYSGINIANNIVSKKFSLSHAKLIVFSDEVAQNGVKDFMETIIRSHETRPDIYLAVAIGGANKYLEEVKPVIEVNPAKYYQLIYSQRASSGVPKNVAQEFYFSTNRLYRDGTLPLAGILQNSTQSGSADGGTGSSAEESSQGGGGSSEDDSKTENELQKNAPFNEEGFEFRVRNYKAGEVAIKEKNKSEVMGMALFKDNRMIGSIGGIDTELFNILSGTYNNGYISFYSQQSADVPITAQLQQRKKPKIKVKLDENKIKIKLYLEAELFSLPADYQTENDILNFESETKQYITEACADFLRRTLRDYNVDVLGLVTKAKSNFLTYPEFENRNYDFSDFDIEIETEFYVRHSGLTMRKGD